MPVNVAEQRQLHEGSVGDRDVRLSLPVDEVEWRIVENGKGKLSAIAQDQDTVFPCAFVRHKTPRPGGRHAIVEAHRGRHGVFGSIQPSAVGRVARSLHDGSEELLQKVQLMRCEVVEIPSSGNVGLQAPWQVAVVAVELPRGCFKA